MAKYQTRKSLSINGALFRRMKAFAGDRISLAQLTEQALEAVLDGRIVVAPRDPSEPRERAPEPPPTPVEHPTPPPPRLRPDPRLKPFCANCTGPTIRDPNDPRRATMQPLGRGGELVTICHDCSTLSAADPRYDFGNAGGARRGLGEGGKRVGANGAGR